MKHEEETMQVECVKVATAVFHFKDGLLCKATDYLHHSPNGGYRNPREGARFKAMGTKAGFPDLFLAIPNDTYHGLFVEMKSAKGKQKPSQKEWQRMLEYQGYCYKVCRSVAEFIGILRSYLPENYRKG